MYELTQCVSRLESTIDLAETQVQLLPEIVENIISCIVLYHYPAVLV